MSINGFANALVRPVNAAEKIMIMYPTFALLDVKVTLRLTCPTPLFPELGMRYTSL